jgi:HAMP domain-containing protein
MGLIVQQDVDEATLAPSHPIGQFLWWILFRPDGRRRGDFLLHHISKPVHALAIPPITCRRRFDPRSQNTKSRDEIGRLADTFRKMIDYQSKMPNTPSGWLRAISPLKSTPDV